jgi:gamma-glutamylcyclotransferase (GGCT)/AIG2-like uncharacterized protein YtfP
MGLVRSVFVYGTLMPGGTRWDALSPFATSWEPATANGELWDTGHGFPAARFGVGAAVIHGYVVNIGDDCWPAAIRRLDEIEGEGALYRRCEVQTSRGSATTYEWMGSVEGFRLLPDGWITKDGD